MGLPRSASLARRFPRRIDIPVLLAASAGLMLAGVIMPAVETRTLGLWKDEYSVILNIAHLNDEGKHAAAAVLAACVLIYPAVKIIILAWFWFMPFPHRWRARCIRLLRLLGRWAMLDVITVSAIILGGLVIGPLDAEPKPGLFIYAGGIVSLMVVSLLMDRLARMGR